MFRSPADSLPERRDRPRAVTQRKASVAKIEMRLRVVLIERNDLSVGLGGRREGAQFLTRCGELEPRLDVAPVGVADLFEQRDSRGRLVVLQQGERLLFLATREGVGFLRHAGSVPGCGLLSMVTIRVARWREGFTNACQTWLRYTWSSFIGEHYESQNSMGRGSEFRRQRR